MNLTCPHCQGELNTIIREGQPTANIICMECESEWNTFGEPVSN